MTVAVNRLGDVMGAEITGADLSRPLDEDTFAAIRRAFLDHQVVVVRGQRLMAEQQVAFCARFGAVEDQVGTEYTASDVPKVAVISNDRKGGQLVGKVDAGDFWHSDSTYRAVPSLATFLQSVRKPGQGGDTEFANMYLAFDALSDDMKARIAGLHGVNTVSRLRNPRVTVSQNRPGAKARYRKLNARPDALHPVARVHPETGRTALYVSPRFTIAIHELPDEEGQPLLDALFEHQVRSEYVYRHTWREDDFVFWDNRCVLHRAVGGYAWPDIRTLHRSVVTETGYLGTEIPAP